MVEKLQHHKHTSDAKPYLKMYAIKKQQSIETGLCKLFKRKQENNLLFYLHRYYYEE